MKTNQLAIGSLLALLIVKAMRPTSARPSRQKVPSTAPSSRLPSEGKRPPSSQKPKPTLPKKPAQAPKGNSPTDIASKAFTDAMQDGKSEATARAEALAAYRKAGGRNSAEEGRISRWLFD